MNAWKTVLLCTLLAMVAAPMFAQATDKAPQVVFRFVEGNDMFYVPWNGNGTALDSLCRMIKPETLDKGSVKVDGYSDTKKLSMILCNRVKSELITRKGLQEEHFTTTNNVGEWNGLKNVVFVTLPILYKVETEKRQETQRQDKPALTDSQKQSETAATSQEETTPVNEIRQIAETTSSRTDNTDYGTLSLRANLLRWATLTPTSASDGASTGIGAYR